MTITILIIMFLIVSGLTIKVIKSKHRPHLCKRNQLYWEDEFGRGTFCDICGKIISLDSYETEI